MLTVVKPFNTVNRRFRAGAEVAEVEDVAPHAIADLKARGFLADAKPEPKPGPDKGSLRRVPRDA